MWLWLWLWHVLTSDTTAAFYLQSGSWSHPGRSQLSHNKHGTQHALGRADTKTCALTLPTRTRHHTCRVGQQLKRLPGRQPTQQTTKQTAQHSQQVGSTDSAACTGETNNQRGTTTQPYKTTTHKNIEGRGVRTANKQTHPNAGVVGFSALLRAAQALGHAANTR